MVKKLIFEVCSNCGKKITDDEAAILVDEHNDLIFCNGDCVHEHFEAEIHKLDAEHLKMRKTEDIPPRDFPKYEQFLAMVLNEPDEIWEESTLEDESPLSFFIGEFFHEKEHIFYIAAVYRNEDRPAFVYTHFPTSDIELVEKYRRGEIIYDGGQEAELQLEDDEITEGNIAIELYNEMLENRSEVDIDPEDFGSYGELKLSTVENPEEIWKKIDDSGNTFIIYLAHHQRETETLAYIVVAVEDELIGGAVPVFGFPTLDQKLLDRFRTGELIFRRGEESF